MHPQSTQSPRCLAEFDAPAAVVLADRINVSDTGNRRVQMFSRDGVFLDKLVNPKDREWLRKPGTLTVDAQRNLYVADNGARRIRVSTALYEAVLCFSAAVPLLSGWHASSGVHRPGSAALRAPRAAAVH